MSKMLRDMSMANMQRQQATCQHRWLDISPLSGDLNKGYQAARLCKLCAKSEKL